MAAVSKNIAEQRREQNGIVYYDRGRLTGRAGDPTIFTRGR